jgi:hypothetical protein
VSGLLRGQAIHLLLERPGEFLDQLGRQQAFPEPAQDPPLKLLSPDLQVVAACPLRAMRGAAVISGVDDGESAAAHAALELAAQEILATVRPVEGMAISVLGHDDPHLGLPRLDSVPQLVAHDAQLGYGHDLPPLARVRPSDLLAPCAGP